MSDTVAFPSPSSRNDHHFLLSTQWPSLTAGYSESVWRTYLSFTIYFSLFTLLSLYPCNVKTSLFQMWFPGGIKGYSSFSALRQHLVHCLHTRAVYCLYRNIYFLRNMNFNPKYHVSANKSCGISIF